MCEAGGSVNEMLEGLQKIGGLKIKKSTAMVYSAGPLLVNKSLQPMALIISKLEVIA